ncbi:MULTISPECIES: ABC transporter ATP-binding protein [unclassified Saccharopolyspora]|uniref:ABC transporter ATP-binding protein n=1 Tax=unclassified Saccharopolyspora TaxID=2646250 RepID=UPI001CD4106E|nr:MULTISPECIES: ABC transporter ATP-binding protein [unclassified Saccharopolyspora]MCA1195324.1 ABC transporter ATP-binding protein [Saccharopolyspora sp. 6V]MCA1280347.1 ABC transporter ATP-binding protein [Saccharopolyspora sp. 7B]
MTELRVRDLTAGYRRRTVLTGVSAQVPAGGWLAVIGPNGSGKSTLLKAVAGLLPHRGDVLVGGRPLHRAGRRERARLLAYSPQSPQLPPGLTVTDYVLLGRTPHLGPLGREGRGDLAVVEHVVERLDLAGLARRPLAELSGGERQRAVLGRALAQRSGVLLLDEPTTGLDLGHAQALLDLVDELRRELGTTVVTTLHDLTISAQYADRLLLLADGRTAAHGPPAEVLTPAVLTEHYDARVVVLTAPDGTPVIAPVRVRSG